MEMLIGLLLAALVVWLYIASNRKRDREMREYLEGRMEYHKKMSGFYGRDGHPVFTEEER